MCTQKKSCELVKQRYCTRLHYLNEAQWRNFTRTFCVLLLHHVVNLVAPFFLSTSVNRK